MRTVKKKKQPAIPSQLTSSNLPLAKRETIAEAADRIMQMALESLRNPANHPDYHECDWLRTQHAKSKR